MKLYKPKKSERTRRFIIEKAAPLINKKGVAGTSLADLTTATGLTKGSIYGNFKNKDELVLAVFDYNIDSLFRIFSREMIDAESPVEKLMVYPRVFQRMYKHMVAYGGCPILNTATEADDTHPDLCRRVSETVTAWKQQIVKLIEEGIQNGEIRRDTDAGKIAGLILSLFEGGSILAKVTRDDSYMTGVIEQAETIIQSITAKTERP